MQKIKPFLWFDGRAEEAALFYTSVFKNASMGKLVHMGDGSVLTAHFSIEGMDFIALNGGPAFQFTEAISFVIGCDTQDEIDYYWQKLSEGGSTSRCGWLKDKFGVSWQVVPNVLPRLLQGSDAAKAQRAMQAMMQMEKFDIAALENA